MFSGGSQPNSQRKKKDSDSDSDETESDDSFDYAAEAAAMKNNFKLVATVGYNENK